MEQLNACNCHQNVTEPQGQNISTHVCTNCETGLQLIKHAAHGLVQRTLHVEMVWTDDSTLAIFTCATGSLHCTVVRSIVPSLQSSDFQHRNCESDSNDKRHQQIAMELPLLF